MGSQASRARSLQWSRPIPNMPTSPAAPPVIGQLGTGARAFPNCRRSKRNGTRATSSTTAKAWAQQLHPARAVALLPAPPARPTPSPPPAHAQPPPPQPLHPPVSPPLAELVSSPSLTKELSTTLAP